MIKRRDTEFLEDYIKRVLKTLADHVDIYMYTNTRPDEEDRQMLSFLSDNEEIIYMLLREPEQFVYECLYDEMYRLSRENMD